MDWLQSHHVYVITYPVKVWDDLGYTVEVWEWISSFIQHFINGCNYLSMLWLKLIHVSETDPRECANLLVVLAEYLSVCTNDIVEKELSVKIIMILVNSCIPQWIMRTSSNGNIFRVTGPLCGEFTGHRWIPRTKAGEAELWCFLWSVPE